MSPIGGVTCYQGSETARIPERRGIYAWYYNPVEPGTVAVRKTLGLILGQPGKIKTQVEMRYGVKWMSESPIRITQSSSYRSVNELIESSLDSAESLILKFISGGAFPLFARPLYIGIAKNLYNRVFLGHYNQLAEYWLDTSRVSRFLRSNANADISTVMARTELPHSFALEARTCNISIKDLLVCTYDLEKVPAELEAELDAAEEQPIANDEAPSVRPLEFLLQMLADPAFGRR